LTSSRYSSIGERSDESHRRHARPSGTTYASDDDPELIEAALPFSLKLMESVLG